MLLKAIKFDETTPYWVNDRQHNFALLSMAERFVNDTIRHKGYIYLNQICEQLGVPWNPEDTNPCIRDDGVMRLYFVQFEVFAIMNNSFLVHIHRYD